jgi:hypothetical protein
MTLKNRILFLFKKSGNDHKFHDNFSQIKLNKINSSSISNLCHFLMHSGAQESKRIENAISSTKFFSWLYNVLNEKLCENFSYYFLLEIGGFSRHIEGILLADFSFNYRKWNLRTKRTHLL